MRRIVIIGTALAVLVGAAAAYAGFNTYSASLSFSPNKAGSPRKPVPLGFSLDYKAGGTNGNRTAPITDITIRAYGLRTDGKDFPKCTVAQIAAAHTDASCPKGSLVASGSITSLIGPVANPSAAGLPCNPLLHIYNAGQGKVAEFFVPTAKGTPHACANGAITVGQVGPYPGYFRNQGAVLVHDVPVPSYVSFPLGGVEGSLLTQHLQWFKMTKKVKGKTVSYLSSVGCLNGKRPYSVAFTAKFNGQSQTGISGNTQRCTR